MTHSALNKALSEDVNRETGLEKVIDSVAVFKKPASNSRSVKSFLKIKLSPK